MGSPDLPLLAEVRRRYEIGFDRFGVMLFHPVTSELGDLGRQIRIVVDELLRSGQNYVVIYPNNDHGSDIVLAEYERLRNNPKVRLFPSMRFEYFLSLLKHADFMIGNSSAGVREAPHFGVPAINLGTRQNNRVKCASILDVAIESATIAAAIGRVADMPRVSHSMFGDGNSAQHFHRIVKSRDFWRTHTQKYFVDRVTSAGH
jgi:UDP-N-acetylglucosamine 2-epimerase (hydrolysing)